MFDIAVVSIRMEFEGFPPVGFLQLIICGTSFNTEEIVIVRFLKCLVGRAVVRLSLTHRCAIRSNGKSIHP